MLLSVMLEGRVNISRGGGVIPFGGLAFCGGLVSALQIYITKL